MTRVLRIATRGSALAIAQCRIAIAAIHAVHPDIEVTLVEVVTHGDTDRSTPLREMGGEGVFVAAVRDAVLQDDADVAMHSLKDVPTTPVPGLVIAAMLERGDPRDAFVGREGKRLRDLPAGARVGTSASRRMAILRALRPDITIADIRGNVDTRLAKVTAGEFDGTLLAAAGLQRLGRLHEATEIFEPTVVLPSPAQGVVALECRSDDEDTTGLLRAVDHAETRLIATAERAVLEALGAGCDLGVGAYAQRDGDLLTVHALLASPDVTRTPVTGSVTGRASEGESLGRGLAEMLRARLDGGG